MTQLYAPMRTMASLGQLTPKGWYRRQLEIQAEGLSGHLDEFWPDIMDSEWIGGSHEGWERMPYWLDGFIPLAKLLGRSDMLSRAQRYIDAILARQRPDGWICPGSDEGRAQYDIWAAFLISKVLVLWHDATGDERIEEAVARLLKSIDRHIDMHTLFNWAQARWFEGLIALIWLYERRPEEWIAQLAKKLQAQGFDWLAFFRRWPMTEPRPHGRWSQMNHVVNNAMMLKSPALLMRLFPDEAQITDARRMIEQLDRWHGSANGTFTGDECLAGQSPSAGTELCAVAEYMYSLQHLQSQSDDCFFGDKLEALAFNAWPATFDESMWVHQYVQQANQVQAVRAENHAYRTNGPEANTFGLEPEFGCCTANFSQGWPKLIQSVYYQRAAGIDIALLLPSQLDTEVLGRPVTISIDTGYPFRGTAQITVDNPQQAAFMLRMRIPYWAKGAVASANGEDIPCTAGQYAEVAIIAAHTEISLTLPQEARLEQRPNSMVCLRRGALLYSLAIDEAWEQRQPVLPGHEYPHCDYWIRPASKWNYGIDATQPVAFAEAPMPDHPFSTKAPAVSAQVSCREVNWPLVHDAASPTPDSTPIGNPETLRFIPYGCTQLRITELPVLKD